MAVVKPNVAVAIPNLVGESFDFGGDGGHAAIVAKVGGSAAAVGGGGVLEPFPGVGGFDWRISRIDVGGLDGSLGVVGVHYSWGVFVLVRPCAAEGLRDHNQVQGGEELASSLQVVRRHRSCQGQAPYGKRYVGTQHRRCNGCELLAVVPNFAHGITVVKAMELVGFFPRLPGKRLCEQPSGEAVIANNIVVPPVDKDALSLDCTQYLPLFPSACHGVVCNTGAEAPANCFCRCHFGYQGLPSKGRNGGNLWSVYEKTVTILVSCCLKQGRCLERHRNQKRSWKWTLVENIWNHGFKQSKVIGVDVRLLGSRRAGEFQKKIVPPSNIFNKGRGAIQRCWCGG
jgi:hypothetical protein